MIYYSVYTFQFGDEDGIPKVMFDIIGDFGTTSEHKNQPIGLPFDKFDHKIEDFISWFERSECFLDCNIINDAKKNEYLIANLNSESYATLKKLCIPKNPADLFFKRDR